MSGSQELLPRGDPGPSTTSARSTPGSFSSPDPAGIESERSSKTSDEGLSDIAGAVEMPKGHNPYIGFAAGIASGWTKLIVGHPFDTLKTRIQCAPRGTFNGVVDCFKRTVGNEGPLALYKGAAVPAISWGITDSILMGSLHNYRAWLLVHGFDEPDPYAVTTGVEDGGEIDGRRLSLWGHTVAGALAGWTNAAIAHPTETVKCKLQLQMAQSADKPKEFKGPIDVIVKTTRELGWFGMWRGLPASFIYRTSFFAMFGGFELFNRLFKSWDGTSWQLSAPVANFWAGGLASNLYWFTALPFDNVKNRIMVDNIKQPRYRNFLDAYRKTWMEPFRADRGALWNAGARVRTFYGGFVPVVLRAFPTNAAALAVWEGVMRWQKS